MRELAVQASSETLSDPDRGLLNTEFGQLINEIGRTASSTTFNGIELIGATALDKVIQVGANNVAANDQLTLTLSTTKLDTTTLAVNTGVDLASLANSQAAITAVDGALTKVNTARATFGAFQNRLESSIGSLQIQVENITSAESRIRDVDMAAEMAQFTKHNILQQASTSMLAQANQSTQGILSLLR